MDNIVIVTGGGRGIGAATARLLAANGYAVCVNYRSDRDSAERVVAEITQDGGTAFSCQADVAVESEVEALFDAAQILA